MPTATTRGSGDAHALTAELTAGSHRRCCPRLARRMRRTAVRRGAGTRGKEKQKQTHQRNARTHRDRQHKSPTNRSATRHRHDGRGQRPVPAKKDSQFKQNPAGKSTMQQLNCGVAVALTDARRPTRAHTPIHTHTHQHTRTRTEAENNHQRPVATGRPTRIQMYIK